MKGSKIFAAILVASILLTMAVFQFPSVAAIRGPREDDLSVTFYATQEAAYSALTGGEIDLILSDLTSSQADNAFTNPNIVTVNVPDSGFYEFDLNNNYTIMDYPGIRSPMNYTEMRQAIAFLSDKDYYVGPLLGGKAVRIDQMIAAPYYGWANESLSYPYYPYEYNPAGAKAKLDTTFPVGTTPNPYYDSGNPLSSPYLRQYPADHPQKAGEDLDPLKFQVRCDHLLRLQAGRLLVNWMRKLGVPIDSQEATSSVFYSIVMGDFNYHFYTGGWSVGRFPPMTLYGLYHSNNAFSYGPNYVTGNGTHPKLDALLYAANHATSYSEAVNNTKLAAGYMTETCINVPLWSDASYWAWSKNLLGVVDLQCNGRESGYTFMNAYKTDGSSIRAGTISPPNAVNIVYSSWAHDYSNLDRMNLYSGIGIAPYDPSIDQPGFVQDWKTDAWDDGGELKTRLTLWFRTDGYFAKPVSGDQGENVNASHHFFSSWYMYQVDDGWWSPKFRDLHHISMLDSSTVEIYFDTYSYWNKYAAAGPFLPMDTWSAYTELVTKHTESFAGPTTPGFISTAKPPVWIEYVKFNGVPLTMFTDYNIAKGRLYVYSTLGTGTLEAKYWAVGNPKGYYLGNLPWQTILEGAGMYYCTAYTAGAGGGATYKRNPFYYLETPLLGEVDFLWCWGDYDESRRIDTERAPRTGTYIIDELDLNLAGAAFGSQGTGIPSLNWFPGADLAPPGGVIDVFDQFSITGVNWNEPWGSTSPYLPLSSPPPPSSNIHVTNVAPNRDYATIPDNVSISVTVENQGEDVESFDVDVFLSVYANTTFLARQAVSNLAPGAETTMSFPWNTLGFLTGPYKITAVASKVPNEANVNDNSYTYCMVRVTTTIMCTLTLTVNPVFSTLLPFTINNTRIVAPWAGGLDEGAYTIKVPPTIVDQGIVYSFKKWEDETTDPTRTISLTTNMEISAHYENSSHHSPLAEPPALLYVSPIVANAQPFGSLDISLTIAEAKDLYRWEVELYYDTRFMDIYPSNIVEGPFLKAGGYTVFEKESNDAYNSTHGFIRLRSTLVGASSGVNGNGALATLTVKTRAIGNTVMALTYTKLYNSTGSPIFHVKLEEVGLIRIKMVADINNDGVVNIFDLVLMAGSYGTEIGDGKYDVRFDIQLKYGRIDIFDLVKLASYYGQIETGYVGPVEPEPRTPEKAVAGSEIISMLT